MTAAAVEVSDLKIELSGRDVDVVDEISLEIKPGEVLGLVGESGSGKTTVGMALLGHVRRGGEVSGGVVMIDGRDLAHLNDAALRALRGGTVAYIPQDPGTALNPALTIPVWVTVLVIARDVLIVILGGVLHIVTGQVSFPPLKIGKITTTAQIATVAVVLVGLAFRADRVFGLVAPALIYATAALTVISGVGYIVRANRQVEAHGREEARRREAAGGETHAPTGEEASPGR